MAVNVRQSKSPLPISNGHVPVRAALYARVSSEEQKEKQTIQTQIEYARLHCEREGVSLVEIYTDEAISGTVPFEEREGGKRLLKDARQKKFDVVLIYKIDRLGRNTRLTLTAAHLLEALGVGLKSLTEPFDTSTPAGRFMFSMLASAAQLERDNIRERSIAGNDRLARAGQWIGGYPPRGYRVSPERTLIPDETLTVNGMTEVELIQTIFRWVGNERCSTLEVARRLNEMGMPTGHAKHGHRWARTLIWMPPSVATIIKNPVYMGTHVYRRRSKKGGTQTHQYAVPALIAPELWHRTQQVLVDNISFAKRNTRHREYLLRGILRCGCCGLRMGGITIVKTVQGKQYAYPLYRCNGKKLEMTWRRGRCSSRYIAAPWIEDLVWVELACWIVDGTSLEEALTQALCPSRIDREHWQRSLALVESKLGAQDAQRQRVIALFRKGSITEKDLEKQLADVAKESQVLQETANAFEAKLHSSTDPALALIHIRDHLMQFREALRKGELPPEDKRKIIESLVAEVRVRREAYRGRAKSVALIRQTIPFREGPLEEPQGAVRETVWSREPRVSEEPPNQESVEIVYRFPFPPGERDLLQFAKTLEEQSAWPER